LIRKPRQQKPAKPKGVDLLAAADSKVAELKQRHREASRELIEVRSLIEQAIAAETRAIGEAAVAGKAADIGQQRAHTAELRQHAADLEIAAQALLQAIQAAEQEASAVIAHNAADFVRHHDTKAETILAEMDALRKQQARVDAMLAQHQLAWHRTLRACGGEFDPMQQSREAQSGNLILNDRLRPSRVPEVTHMEPRHE
jgi:hypothetical protein